MSSKLLSSISLVLLLLLHIVLSMPVLTPSRHRLTRKDGKDSSEISVVSLQEWLCMLGLFCKPSDSATNPQSKKNGNKHRSNIRNGEISRRASQSADKLAYYLKYWDY